MLFYIPIIITVIFGIGLVVSFYKNARLRFQLDFLRQISQEEQNKNHLLEIQKIEHIKRRNPKKKNKKKINFIQKKLGSISI